MDNWGHRSTVLTIVAVAVAVVVAVVLAVVVVAAKTREQLRG